MVKSDFFQYFVCVFSLPFKHVLLMTDALLIFFLWEKLNTKRSEWKGQFTVVRKTELMINVTNTPLIQSARKNKTNRCVSKIPQRCKAVAVILSLVWPELLMCYLKVYFSLARYGWFSGWKLSPRLSLHRQNCTQGLSKIQGSCW